MLEQTSHPVVGSLPQLEALTQFKDLDLSRSCPELSVVIPTRNEQENVLPLVRRLSALGMDLSTEFIFVDDSTDSTPAAIDASRTVTKSEIVLIHREPEQRIGGLGGAVIEGFRQARAPIAIVIDADLQHPPELIPEMYAEALRSSADVVIASRYRDQGDAGAFGWTRAALSRGSTICARVLFPDRLRDVTDPMSGFFLIRRDAVNLERLKPDGFKILLEILGRTPRLKICEVPFTFGRRHAGESKASVHEALRFFRLLLNLRVTGSLSRFLRFGIVGVSGLIINSFLLAFSTELLGLFYVVAALLATQGSTLWNFALSEWWVFPNHQSKSRQVQRGIMFFVMNNVALAARIPVIYALTSVLGMHYLLSNIFSLMTLMILRFFTADRFIWGDGFPTVGSRQPIAASLANPIDQ